MVTTQQDAQVEPPLDYIDLFRIMRRAGRKDADKAKAVHAALSTASVPTQAVDTGVRLREIVRGKIDMYKSKRERSADDFENNNTKYEVITHTIEALQILEAEFARAALEPQAKDV